jgi:hypothetical protein
MFNPDVLENVVIHSTNWIGDADGTHLELYMSSKDRDCARRILNDSNIFESDMCGRYKPGPTFGPAKQCFPERFALVSDRLNK